jgi:hypothetical protein
MQRIEKISKHYSFASRLPKWALPVIPIVSCLAVALFLFAVGKAVHVPSGTPLPVYLFLPSGMLIFWSTRLVKQSEKGNNLVIGDIHRSGGAAAMRILHVASVGTAFWHFIEGLARSEALEKGHILKKQSKKGSQENSVVHCRGGGCSNKCMRSDCSSLLEKVIASLL